MGLLKRGGSQSTGKRSCFFLSGLSAQIHKEPPLELICLDSSPALHSLWLLLPLSKQTGDWEEEKLNYFLLIPLIFPLISLPPCFCGAKSPNIWDTLAAHFAPFLISFGFHQKTQRYLPSEKSQQCSRQNCLSEISQLTSEGLKWISFSTRRNLTPLFVIPNFWSFSACK